MTDLKNLNFTDIQIGDKVSFKMEISEEKVQKFADISGDNNPLHMDEIYAQNSKFKQKIAHGMLLGSYFSQLVGMHMPGKKCLYLSQTLNFHNPCFLSDVVSVEGTVREKSDATKILEIDTTIYNQKNILLVDGTAKVMVLE